jgi:tetratricopeptide (TPR) repeat protein
VVELQPEFVEARINRALAREGLKQWREAEEDLTRAIDLGASSPRVFLLRAGVRAQLGQAGGVAADRKEGLGRPPVSELDWVARALERAAKEPQAALEDLEQALKVNPRSVPALQNKANILAESLGRQEEAVAALDRLLEAAPHFMPARSGRAVLLARLGRRPEAHRDIEICLADAAPVVVYQAACVFALTSREQPADAAEALALLQIALHRGFGHDLLGRDTDLDPLRKRPEFLRLTDNSPTKRGSP